MLILGILLCIFSLHVILVSAVEAYWMAKVLYGRRCRLSVASGDDILNMHVVDVML